MSDYPIIEYERYEAELRDGTLVLGKLYRSGDGDKEVVPVTYSNRTQAARAAQREGGVVIQRGRPFYVRLPRGAA